MPPLVFLGLKVKVRDNRVITAFVRKAVFRPEFAKNMAKTE